MVALVKGPHHLFQVITDHHNLEYLCSTKRLNHCQAHWTRFFRPTLLYPNCTYVPEPIYRFLLDCHPGVTEVLALTQKRYLWPHLLHDKQLFSHCSYIECIKINEDSWWVECCFYGHMRLCRNQILTQTFKKISH